MSQIPADLRYVDSHEWLRLEADGTVTVGVTDHAQQLLGDVVFVELPSIGKNVAAGDQIGIVESVKAASDVYAPVSGVIVDINADLETVPELVNSDPYDAGWFFRIKPDNSTDFNALLSAEQYASEIGD